MMESIFSMTWDLFNVICQTAELLWTWFSQPIDESLAEFMGLPLTTTNIEMVFGSILILALVGAIYKLFSPLA